MTEFLVTRLKEANSRVWMMSPCFLRRAVITGDLSLSMPGLLKVVADSVGIWPLINSYLKKTCKKDNRGSLVV